mmetsp:Transcript_29107/g.79904  ORF Transcript_29107/g.79904 Transcript_29107/m.79904 type:complete len:240 (-) Transcript_29107:27-746(-)
MRDVLRDGLVLGGDDFRGSLQLARGRLVAARLNLLQVLVNEAPVALDLLLDLVSADNLQRCLCGGLTCLHPPVDPCMQLLLNLLHVLRLELVSELVHGLEGLCLVAEPVPDVLDAMRSVEAGDVLLGIVDAGDLVILALLQLTLRLRLARCLDLIQVRVHQVRVFHALRGRVRAEHRDHVLLASSRAAATDEQDSCGCKTGGEEHCAGRQHAAGNLANASLALTDWKGAAAGSQASHTA